MNEIISLQLADRQLARLRPWRKLDEHRLLGELNLTRHCLRMFVLLRLISACINNLAPSCQRNKRGSRPRRYSLISRLGGFTILDAFLVLYRPVFVDSRTVRGARVLFASPSVTLTESLRRHVFSWRVIMEAFGKSHLPEVTGGLINIFINEKYT